MADSFEQYLENLNDAIHSVQFGVRSLIYHRLIKVNVSTESHFWNHVNTQLLRSYVIYWSNVLGSHTNKTHWKKLTSEVNQFRQQLLQTAGVSREDLEQCWREQRVLRDKVMAHDDPDKPRAIPDLSVSFSLIKALHPLLKEEAYRKAEAEGELVRFSVTSIEDWASDLEKDANVVVEQAITATKNLQDA